MPQFDPSRYVDVQERIVRFWNEHPDGALLTELMSPPDDFNTCRYKAIVFKHRDDKTPSATGYAFEIAGGSGANRTSHEENCETSAIGRALANMGYATNRDDRPSQQEMNKTERVDSPVRRQEPRRDAQPRQQASSGQRTEQAATPRQHQFIKALGRELAMSEEELEAESSQSFARKVDQLNRRDASIFIERLQQRRSQQAGPPARNDATPSGPPEPIEPPDDNDSDNDSDQQAMIDDFNTHYPPADLAEKHRQ